MVIGGKEITKFGRQVQVQDMDIIKEVVVNGARVSPPIDGAGKMMRIEILYT